MGTDGKSLVKEDKKTKLETPIKNVATGIVGGAGEVAGKAVGGVGEVAGKSVEVVGDVAGKTIDTADSLIRDTAGTAGGLVKDTASGIAGLFKMSPTSVKEKKEDNYRLPGLQTGLGTRTNNTALPSKNHRTAEFDYMGAVPQKKSTQFMPVTADFSAFSR